MSSPRSSGRLLRAPSPAMVVACIALAVALTGAGYAAVTLPAKSVGTRQLKPNAVTGKKVKKDSLTGADVKEKTLKIPALGSAVTVSGVAFAPRDSTSTYAYQGGGAIYRTGGADPYAYFVAPLQLPQGARITKVTFYVVDNDALDFTVALTRYRPSTQATEDLRVVSTSSLTNMPDVQAIDVSPPAWTERTVNNKLYDYNLLANPETTDPNHQIVGARVEYGIPAGSSGKASPRPAAVAHTAVTDG